MKTKTRGKSCRLKNLPIWTFQDGELINLIERELSKHLCVLVSEAERAKARALRAGQKVGLVVTKHREPKAQQAFF